MKQEKLNSKRTNFDPKECKKWERDGNKEKQRMKNNIVDTPKYHTTTLIKYELNTPI